MSTQNTIGFLASHVHTLSVLADRASAIRYDLVGAAPPSGDGKATAPAATFDPGNAPFEHAVEYYGNQLNELANRLGIELEILRDNVNHKVQAVAATGKSY